MYDPRTIAFLTELFHPPQAPDPARIQQVHNDLFSTGRPAYSSFAVQPTGAVLSNPVGQPGANSSATFLPDRIILREEHSSLTMEDFAERAQDIAQRACAACGIQVFTAQKVIVRSLVNPRHFSDSRSFLKSGMFGFDTQTEPFERDPKLFGMRMVFPIENGQPQQYSVRIESFASDPRSLFVENEARFTPILVPRGLDPITENIKASYNFLVERALAFVARFDHPQGV